MRQTSLLNSAATLAIASTALISASGLSLPAAAQTAESTAASDQIETVVVSARRRSEQLLDTPVAVTAYGAKDLDKRNILNIGQLAQSVPSLDIQQTAGNPSDAQIFLRGVGNANPGDFQDPGVGIYIDGVYFGRSPGALFDTVDVQDIEVLRGPQGTLFGRNTIGGAVSITTVEPDDALGGDASLQYGSYNDFRGKATVNIPVVDELVDFRTTVLYEHNDGYSFNDTTGQRDNNIDDWAIQSALRITPSQSVTIDLQALYDSDQSNGSATQCNMLPGGTSAPGVGLLGLIGADYPALCAQNNARGPRHFTNGINPSARVYTGEASATVTWDAGQVGNLDDLTFKAIGGYVMDEPRKVLNASGISIPTIVSTEVGLMDQTFSGELQAIGSGFGDRLNFVVGLYYDRENSPEGNDGYIFSYIFPFLGAPTNELQKLHLNNSSKAVYGQATYKLTDVISLTAGLRYTAETTGFWNFQANSLASAPTVPIVILDPGTNYSADFSNLSPMATVQFTAPASMLSGTDFDQAMLYFTYAQGYKSGGFNGNGNVVDSSVTKFLPESVDSYEVGFKWAAFANRLAGSGALYYMPYKNIQIAAIQFNPSGAPIDTINNAASAVIKGAELETQAFLTDRLEFDLSASWTDAKFLKYQTLDPATGKTISQADEPFTDVFPWKLSPSLEYKFELADGERITPRVELDYDGPRWVVSSASSAARMTGHQPATALLNAQIRWDIRPDLALTLNGSNLTNKLYLVDGLDVSAALGSTITIYGPPREFSIRLEKSF
ncbi:MAG TPA: TonB-dependent receptor [Xanthobacteraceae bacterium]